MFTQTISQLKTLIFIPALCFLALGSLEGQTEDRGLILNGSDAYQGYTLFSPLGSTKIHLIDMDGKVVHEWESEYQPSNSAYLSPNGDLLRGAKHFGNDFFGSRGPSGGRVQRLAWDGTVLWDYLASDEWMHQHHDIEPLPNGNILILVWDRVTPEDALAAGRKEDSIAEKGIWPDAVIEVKQTGKATGEIVWKWRAWDHLIQDHNPEKENYGDVAAHPELIDVNLNTRASSDWMHTNAVAYNPDLDQIILSCRSFNELIVIDHSTTSEEAAGHTGGRSGMGGDILYRWGNPSNYRAGSMADQKFFLQHDTRWIQKGMPGEGSIMIYNNGNRRPAGNYSSIDVIVPPLNENGTYHIKVGSAFGPQELEWGFVAETPTDFYSSFISGADRLPNGNTLICSGSEGIFFEVTPQGKTVWKYLNPFEVPPRGPEGPYSVFRVTRYAPDYSGLSRLWD